MSTTVIRKHISYLVRRGISKLPIPLRGERSAQRKSNQAKHPVPTQAGVETAQADFDPPGAERRCSRRTAEPYSVGHSGYVIKQKHLNGFLSLKSFKNKGEKMNTITIAILLVVAAVLWVVLIAVPGIRAIIYARSEEWKLQQRMRRILQHEAE